MKITNKTESRGALNCNLIDWLADDVSRADETYPNAAAGSRHVRANWRRPTSWDCRNLSCGSPIGYVIAAVSDVRLRDLWRGLTYPAEDRERRMEDETLTATIPATLAAALRAAVASGEFPSTDAALAGALESWARRHEDAAEDLAWLKASLMASISDPRPSVSIDEARAHMRALAANVKKRPDEAA